MTFGPIFDVTGPVITRDPAPTGSTGAGSAAATVFVAVSIAAVDVTPELCAFGSARS